MGSKIGTQHVEVQANTYNGAKALIERIYHPEQIYNLYEHGPMSHKGSSSSSSSDGSGEAIGAIVGGTFGLVGAGLGWMGSQLQEGMDEADREREEAEAAGGEVWKKYQEDEAKFQKKVNRVVKYGGGYLGICVVGLFAPEIATVMTFAGVGYVGHKVYTKWIKKDNNTPPQVQEKYRKESIK